MEHILYINQSIIHSIEKSIKNVEHFFMPRRYFNVLFYPTSSLNLNHIRFTVISERQHHVALLSVPTTRQSALKMSLKLLF